MLTPRRPAAFGKLVAADTEKWPKAIKDGGVPPDWPMDGRRAAARRGAP
jgi:hypothetical protein